MIIIYYLYIYCFMYLHHWHIYFIIYLCIYYFNIDWNGIPQYAVLILVQTIFML